MAMVVNAARDLRSAIALVQSVNRKGCVQIDTCDVVALTAKDDDNAFSVSRDSVGDSTGMGAKGTFSAYGKMPLPVIVSGAALKATLTGAKPKAEVAITVDPDPDGNPHTVRVNAGMGDQRIPVLRVGDSMRLEMEGGDDLLHTHTISMQVGDLASMLLAVETAVDNSELHPWRGGVLFEHQMTDRLNTADSVGPLTAVATNARRLHRGTSQFPVRVHATDQDEYAYDRPGVPFLIRRTLRSSDVRVLKTACKRSDASSTVSVQLMQTLGVRSAVFLFPNGDTVLVNFLLHMFPDYKRIIPEQTESDDGVIWFEFDAKELAARLKSMVQSVPVGYGRNTAKLVVDFESNWMRAVSPNGKDEYASGPFPRAEGSNDGLAVEHKLGEIYGAIASVPQQVGRMQMNTNANMKTARVDGVGEGPPFMALLAYEPVVKKVQ